MASYSITNSTSSVTFYVSGLNYGDNVRIYVRYSDTQNMTAVDSFPNVTGSTLTLTFTVATNCNFVANVNVNGVWLGAKSFSTIPNAPAVVRPSNWYWTNTFTQGQRVNITAYEWNNFLRRINEFRAYKNLTAYSFTSVVSGYSITAAQVNQARSAISDMTYSSLPAMAVSGNPIYPSFFYGLSNALNSIS